MPADPALAAAVEKFCDSLAPRLTGLAGAVAGMDPDAVARDVELEAYTLAAACIDSDGLHSDSELLAFAVAFAARIGGSLAQAGPDEIRDSGLLAGKAEWLTTPSAMFEVLLAADQRDGTALASLYYDRALQVAFTVASLDEFVAPAELAAIESFRGMMLCRIGQTRQLDPVGAARQAAAGGSGPAGPVDEPEPVAARPVEEVLAELDELVGLAAVKTEVRRVADLTRVQLLRAQRGLPVAEQSRHLVFSGNPGTGKTTVARLLAEIYHALGILGRGHLVEVDRAGLVAGFVGQTATKVTEVFDRADGGMLLVDEAYALVRGSETDFGREAIDTIVKLVEDRRDRVVVVMAGYPDEMAALVEANPGMRSRFPKTIHFPDYDTDELVAIFTMRCESAGYTASAEAAAAVRSHLDAVPRTRGFGNGRVARNLLEEAITRHASRIVGVESPSDQLLSTLEAADIPPLGFAGDLAGVSA